MALLGASLMAGTGLRPPTASEAEPRPPKKRVTRTGNKARARRARQIARGILKTTVK